MKAYIITLQEPGKEGPIESAMNCLNSVGNFTNCEPEIFSATTPANLTEGMKEAFGKKVRWTWPMDEHQNGYDLSTGLFKKCYRAVDQHRVMSCAVSHARLWRKCVELDEPILILEHDAIFIKKFDISIFDGYVWEAIGLNDPSFATRKAKIYCQMIRDKGNLLQQVPNIDGHGFDSIPNGLAGNSAYIIKPVLAKKLLKKVDTLGLWPNDALLCKQLFPKIRVCYPYFTQVQLTMSTTTF